MMKRFSAYITALLLSTVFLASSVASAGDYKVGVLAKRGVAKAIKNWGLTDDYLTEKLQGDTFAIVPLDFDEVFPAIESSSVDFFLVNSSMFVTAKVRYGASTVATMVNSRQGETLKSFGGVILTYIDRDDINSLDDIKGKKFMAVKESSFGGWQMAYKEFLDKGINPMQDFTTLEFGGKHDNVVLAVQNGEMDAGTVRTDTLERMAAAGDIDLSEFKIIDAKTHTGFPFVVSTSLYPEWPFAKLASTPDEITQRVANVLIDMKAETKAAKSAKIVGWTTPLDYADVENLQMLLKVGAYQ